jgi:hypothetical protein
MMTIGLQAQIIPADRKIDWNLNIVGVPGGIPNRTTIYTTIDAATYGNGTTDASAVINTTISNCPPDQVVYLPAGTYRVNSTIKLSKSKMTLRGAGMGKTIILGQVASGDGIIAMPQDNAMAPERAIISGYTKGSTRIVVDNPSNIAAGSMLKIFQTNDTAFIWSPHNEKDCLQQRVVVTAVSGSNVDFYPPLVWTYTSTLHPRWRYMYPTNGINFTGIEELSIKRGASNMTAQNVWFMSTYACWVKNVESSNCEDQHFLFTGCLRNEIRGSYMYETSTDNEGYGIILYGGIWSDNTGFLIEDNAATKLFVFIGIDKTVGSVIAYNYAWDMHTNVWDKQTAAFSPNHMPHSMMNLWEGNVGQQYQDDGYHGSSSHQTLFRNWFNGLHPNYTQNRKMIDLCRYSYYNNIVGNVLGSPEWAAEMYEMTGNDLWYSHSCIYRLGYPHMGNNGYVDGYPPSGTMNPDSTFDSDGNSGHDPRVKATLLRHGNYDYQTQSTIWDSSIASHNLPASLYRTSKPDWFGAVPWPPIGPDVPGLVNKIPAQLRFETLAEIHPPCLPGISPSGKSITFRRRGAGFYVIVPVSVRSPELDIVDLLGRGMYHAKLVTALRKSGTSGNVVFECTRRMEPAVGTYIAIVKESFPDGRTAAMNAKYVFVR